MRTTGPPRDNHGIYLPVASSSYNISYLHCCSQSYAPYLHMFVHTTCTTYCTAVVLFMVHTLARVVARFEAIRFACLTLFARCRRSVNQTNQSIYSLSFFFFFCFFFFFNVHSMTNGSTSTLLVWLLLGQRRTKKAAVSASGIAWRSSTTRARYDITYIRRINEEGSLSDYY